MVGTASSGIDAMSLVEETEPDVVLMDVRMPEMNGIEATRRLKSAFPEIGIVALTGVDDQDAVREMLVAGASCYVLKDSDSDEIFHAIRQAAAGGGVISSEVTPRVIGELTEALERERRRARQLELAQEALLERAARRHELVSRLGHELRTPVTVILGMAQTLSKGTGTLDQRDEMLSALVMRAQGLARLVARLEGVVEAGLTEYTDVIDIAEEIARLSPRVQDRDPRPADARDPQPRGRPAHPRGARGERARVLGRARAGHRADRRVAGRDRGSGHRPGPRDHGGRARQDLRAARAGRGAPHPDAPGGRAGAHGGPDVRARDGWGRHARTHRPLRLGLPLAGLDEPLRRRPFRRSRDPAAI